LTVRAQTVSTNDDALFALKEGAPTGSLFVAEQQTAGRGRHGREWHSVTGESLTFSLVLRPRIALGKLSVVTLIVGLAVKDALQEHHVPGISIKWPNDVVHQDKKLVGILVEKPGILAKDDTGLVVGVGLNVGVAAIPAALAGQATALAELVANVPTREELLASILWQLQRRIGQLEAHGFSAILPDMRASDALLERAITVEGRRGRAKGIADGGELLVEFDGRIEVVSTGTVSYAK
jgi:BirA family biotin operon repressor/biotin-[acetyl-CoA-carboxylase] ligase